jgi:hypothetical protein
MVAVNGNNQPRNLSPSCHRASASAASRRVPPRPRHVAPSPPLPSASAVATPCGFASVGRAPPSIMCRALWAGKRRRERLKKRRGRKEFGTVAHFNREGWWCGPWWWVHATARGVGRRPRAPAFPPVCAGGEHGGSVLPPPAQSGREPVQSWLRLLPTVGGLG